MQLIQPFTTVQQYYAVIGACFIPMLALTLLILNSRSRYLGPRYRNRPATTAALVIVLLLAVLAAGFEIISGSG